MTLTFGNHCGTLFTFLIAEAISWFTLMQRAA